VKERGKSRERGGGENDEGKRGKGLGRQGRGGWRVRSDGRNDWVKLGGIGDELLGCARQEKSRKVVG